MEARLSMEDEKKGVSIKQSNINQLPTYNIFG